jgi:hypothetical protein
MNPDPSPSDDPDHRLDIDARFAEIIADWEPSPPDETPPRALTDDPRPGSTPDGATPDRAGPASTGDAGDAGPPSAERLRGLFQPSWNDPLDSEATWEDEGHFVPPPPPPLPRLDPNRRLAWLGLVGTPLVTLLLIGAGIRVSAWMGFLLVVTFVGSFGFLVATMRSGPPDDWAGDDGARL